MRACINKISNENKESIVEVKVVKGYKVFDPNWTCKGFKYEVGKSYEMDDDIECCGRGFHFCTKLIDCFKYYNFNSNNKVAEVEACGKIDYANDGSTKACTNKIRIVREIPWDELLSTADIIASNTGTNNAGIYNTGNCNNGSRNAGNYNTGDYNTGDYNTGDRNTSCSNNGDYNTGIGNTGDYNTGDFNTGSCNAGCSNNGYYNIGNRNVGDCNTGDYNTGDYNTGNNNMGSYNTGSFNATNHCYGWFCVKEPKVVLFDKPTDMAYEEWKSTRAYEVLCCMPYAIDGERQEWYDNLSDENKDIIKSIPNFDTDIFKQCTGIDVNKDK